MLTTGQDGITDTYIQAFERMSQSVFNFDHRCFRQLFESSPDPTLIIHDNRFVECNDAAIKTLGYNSREELLNVHPARFSPSKQSDGEHSFDKAKRMMAIARNKGVHRYEWIHTKANNSTLVAEVTLSTIELEDTQVLYCVLRDITERKQIEQQVRQLAFYDALTNLPNRRLLNDRLGQAMAASKRSNCYGAVIFLDLDNFKPINDTHGHVVGDMLLIEAADRLRNCVREMDTVARYGGDEFVVILGELNADEGKSAVQAGLIAEKIRSALSDPYPLAIRQDGNIDMSIQYRCTASVGVALFIDHEAGQDEIIKWADAAMYESKKAGRNAIRFCEMTIPKAA